MQCIGDVIHHGFVSEKAFDDLKIPRGRDFSGEEVERHGQSDIYGRTMTISTERTLIPRHSRTIRDLEQQRQEQLRKNRVLNEIMQVVQFCDKYP